MKATQLLWVVGMLLATSTTNAVQIQNENRLWSELEVSNVKNTTQQKKHKHKKHRKHFKSHKSNDGTLVGSLEQTGDDSKAEASIITDSVKSKLNSLMDNNASLSDMYQFSKVIANGKTVKEAAAEEESKVQALAIIEKTKDEESKKKLEAIDAIDQEEADKKQEAIDVTTRKMLAQQYEQMEIDDERREGIDNGFQSYKVVSDMKAEQDYAINNYKGSGEMSDMFDELKSDAIKQRQKEKQQLAVVNQQEKALHKDDVTIEKGEGLIGDDSQSMYAFSAFAAANAANVLEK